jgi:hypothetical protein
MMKAAPLPATILFVLSLALNLWFAGAPDWRWIPAALAAWYVADLLSGLTHMYMDYRPCTPGVGLDEMFRYAGSRESADYLALRDRVMPRISPFERLVYDFKNHHPRAGALGRRSFVVQIGSTILFVSLPDSILLNLLCVALRRSRMADRRSNRSHHRRHACAIFPRHAATRRQSVDRPRNAACRPADDAGGACAAPCHAAAGLRDEHRLVQPAGQCDLSRRDQPRLADRTRT